VIFAIFFQQKKKKKTLVWNKDSDSQIRNNIPLAPGVIAKVHSQGTLGQVDQKRWFGFEPDVVFFRQQIWRGASDKVRTDIGACRRPRWRC
jgi:hypothetical protein